MTEAFAPVPRRPPAPIATADVAVAAPPEVPSQPSRGLPARVLPILVSVAGVGFMAAAFASGSPVTRNPMFLAFPAVTLVSMVVAGITGRGGRRGGIDADRADYLDYLGRLRRTVTETAAAQRARLNWTHPAPDALWTLVGGPRMWERRAGDCDFRRVRLGVGTQPLATPLVEPEIPQHADPVTAAAVRRFIRTHGTVAGPLTIDVRDPGTVTIEGDAAAARALGRAVVCQLAVLHSPDVVAIVGAIADAHRAQWDWLKWLPHTQHPSGLDAAGSARMVYPSPAQARDALAAAGLAQVVVIADLDEPAAGLTEATVLEIRTGRDGAPLTVTQGAEVRDLAFPDRLDPLAALVCARRLARYRFAGVDATGWPSLVGLGEPSAYDPTTLWRRHSRLRAPIGTTAGGAPLDLDIKEAAENGIGPHGLCIGATGSGKSELLRTIVLGMMVHNSPEALNLLLVDFKGGATFLDLARAPHVAAVITNLSDEAPLVTRMRDALAGEMDRRQRILRAARCVSVAAYERARRAGDERAALPTLLIVVDEFSELLGQHPDFADTFVGIGRLGRSLGMHLLLASQRLDEGRLRGLDAHLSYRVCLKTLSAGDSRAVLGTLDAYDLPNAPGAGLLQVERRRAGRVSGGVRFGARQRRGGGPRGGARGAAVRQPSCRHGRGRRPDEPGPAPCSMQWWTG